MRALEGSLLGLGFRVFNINYPSHKYPVQHLAEHVGNAIHQRCTDCTGKGRIHFVTHSLGGIVLRYYLKENPPNNLGRVVMLSPPNQGSDLVDILKGNVFFKVVTGPSGQQLGTDSSSVPITLGPVDFELGIIVGNRSLNPIFSHLIPGEDDGRVSVARSKVEGMTDFIIVPQSHPFIMNSPEVIEQAIHFLEHGRFLRRKQERF